MAHRQQKQDLRIWRCAASTRRKLHHQVWDLESIRRMTMKEKEMTRHQETGSKVIRNRKSKILKWVDKRRFSKPLGNWCKKGSRPNKQWGKSPGTRKLPACSPEFKIWKRSWECLQSMQLFQRNHTKQCVDMVNVFSVVDEGSHPLGSGFLDEFGNLQEHKIREKWSVFNIPQKLIKGTFWRNSECGMPGIFITIMDEINFGERSSGHVGEGKSMCLRWFRSLCRTGEIYFRSNRKMERSRWRSQEVFVVPRRSGTRRRTDWIRAERISQHFRHYLFFARSRTTWRHRTSSQKTFRMPKKSRITPWSSCQDIGRFWAQDRKRSGMAIPTIKKDSGIAPPTRWYSDWKRLVILVSQVPVLWVVESWSKGEANVPFTSMDFFQKLVGISSDRGAWK